MHTICEMFVYILVKVVNDMAAYELGCLLNKQLLDGSPADKDDSWTDDPIIGVDDDAPPVDSDDEMSQPILHPRVRCMPPQARAEFQRGIKVMVFI